MFKTNALYRDNDPKTSAPKVVRVKNGTYLAIFGVK